ncbi:MAG: MFS transporter [Bacteroidetes bacterium]|nr:MFS transporter [Bacteroidota bacterium]
MKNRKYLILLVLIIAAESIYFLPFVMARIFRPTLLNYFQITNSELGLWFALYGLVAMASYLAGGPLADRFSARKLMALALMLTSLGGFMMAFVRGPGVMRGVYVLWGFTTIFLFWAPMIRTTRLWGKEEFQGRMFGWLEGGRGFVAALLGTSVFFLFREVQHFKLIIVAISLWTLFVGVLVWVYIPDGVPGKVGLNPGDSLKRVGKLLGKPTLWMLSGLIICSYASYKITDDYSLYAREVLGFSEVGAAGIGTAALWLRGVVAILAGWLGDRFNRIRVIMICFGITACAGILIGSGILPDAPGIILLNLSLTASGIFGVRALYFAILGEADVSIGNTGTAVGIISFVGFTPEIFMSPWMGHLLDSHPGVDGHRYVFLLLSLVAFCGLLITLIFRHYSRK